jgi:ABC-type Mn2+/Zn2+ transport system permease subunit
MSLWTDFAASWPLLGEAYLAGWLAGALLATWGVLLLARNQVFLGAAASEMAALGVAIALLAGFHAPHGVGGHEHGLAATDWRHRIDGPAWAALIFAVVTCLLAAGRTDGRHSREAVTGWFFLFGAGFSLLLVSQAPLGREEVEQALASTILGASDLDQGLLVTCGLASLWILGRRFPDFYLFATEPDYARACGLAVGRWTVAVYLPTGLAIGLGMHVAGFLYTFACLLLPPMTAKYLCRTLRAQLVVAPLCAVVLGVLAFALANHYDFPPAQMAVGVLALGVPLARLCGRRSV